MNNITALVFVFMILSAGCYYEPVEEEYSETSISLINEVHDFPFDSLPSLIYVLLGLTSVIMGVVSIIKADFRKIRKLPLITKGLFFLSYVSLLLGLLFAALNLINMSEVVMTYDDFDKYDIIYILHSTGEYALGGVITAFLFFAFYIASLIRFNRTKPKHEN